MNFLTFSCFILPLWAAIFAIYFILRRANLQRESVIAKCAGSFLAVTSAGAALLLQHENPFVHLAFWVFVLCTAADALLELSFVPGMILFGAGHVCLILWLRGLASVSFWTFPIWLFAYGLAIFLFRREIPKLGKLLLPFCLYPALLSMSLALAFALPITAGLFYLPLAAGALCFFISDLMVAKGYLTKSGLKYDKLVMFLYWLALYLISSGLWR